MRDVSNSSDARERRRREGESGSFVDMRIDFEINGEVLLPCGGVWSVREKELVGDASDCKIRVPVRIHPGQAEAVQWFRDWIRVHAGRRDNPPQIAEDDEEIDTDPAYVFSALFAGGRRGGKTWIAAAICAAYAVQFPGAIVWAISPSRGKDDTKADEIRRYMSTLLDPKWIQRQTLATGWELINGSAIMLKSAHTGADPDAIKEGQADLVWLNEGQKMSKRVYTVARGAISDKSGLVLVCANPPVESKDQQWVSDFAADTDAGRRASVHIPFDPLKNPHINRKSLLALSAEVDDRTFQIEVLGMFMPAIDSVAYNWLRSKNERARPTPVLNLESGGQTPCPITGLIDVTAEFLELEEEGDGITDLIGLDVQRIPYIGGPVYRFYAPPDIVPTRDNVMAWIVDEIVLDGGDEVDWCGELRESGYRPESTLIVCDASGRYQHSRRRTADSPPPEWKGKGSFDIIRGEGYTRIVPPSRRMNKNPDISDRIRAFTSMICTRTLKRRLYADRDLAPKTCNAIREWKTVNGKPSRTMDVAHLGDGISYPLIRLFPRILRSDKPGGVDPITSRVDPKPQGQGATDRFFGAPRPSGRRAKKNHGL